MKLPPISSPITTIEITLANGTKIKADGLMSQEWYRKFETGFAYAPFDLTEALGDLPPGNSVSRVNNRLNTVVVWLSILDFAMRDFGFYGPPPSEAPPAP